MIRLALNKILSKVRPGKEIPLSLNITEVIGFYFPYIPAILRGLLFKLRGANTKLIFLGKSTRISFPSKIDIKSYSRIGDFCTISGLGKTGLQIGEKVSIGSYSRIVVSTDLKNPGEHIKIMNGVGIGEYASLGGSGGLIIGENTIIAQYFSAHPENHLFNDTDVPIKFQGTKREPIIIGKDCWIGAKVTVLAGVKIGDGVVLGAGSVVTKDIPDYSIAVGNPAKVLGQRGGL